MRVIVGQVGGKENSVLQIIGAVWEAFLVLCPTQNILFTFNLKVCKPALSFLALARIVPLPSSTSFPHPEGFSFKSFQEILKRLHDVCFTNQLKGIEFHIQLFSKPRTFNEFTSEWGNCSHTGKPLLNPISKNRESNKQSDFSC